MLAKAAMLRIIAHLCEKGFSPTWQSRA